MCGLVKITNKGLQKWKTQLHYGHLFDVARFNNATLVLSAPEWTNSSNSWTVLKSIKDTLINPANGKIVLEKEIPVEEKNFAEIIVHKNDAGEFQQLLVRHTKWTANKGMNINKYEKEARLTEAIQFFSLDKDLLATQTNLLKITNNDLQYTGSATTADCNTFIAWATNNSLLLEQYEKGATKPAAKVSTPFEWNEKVQPEVLLKINPLLSTQAVVAVQYNFTNQNIIKTVQFDMAAKKVYSSNEPLTNDYRKTLEGKVEAAEGQGKDIEKRIFANMKISDILYHGTNAIVVKETRGLYTHMNSATRYYTGDAIFTVFDQNGVNLKNFLISKYVERFIGIGLSFGSNVIEDKLQLVTVESINKTSFSILYGSINLKEMKWGSLALLKEGAAVAKADGPINPASTVWFGGGAVLSRLDQKAFGGASMVTELKVMKAQ